LGNWGLGSAGWRRDYIKEGSGNWGLVNWDYTKEGSGNWGLDPPVGGWRMEEGLYKKRKAME